MNTQQCHDFPVPVVRLIIPDEERRVLVLRRDKTAYGQGAWCLPGGKVDYGKTVLQAVADELREETGLICESTRFLCYQDSPPMRPGLMQCLNLYFECHVSGIMSLNRDESSASAWIGRDDLDRYGVVFGGREILKPWWNGQI